MQKFLSYLKENKITTMQLAIICNVDENTVFNWMNGVEQIDSRNIVKLIVLSLGELSIFDFFDDYNIEEIIPNYKTLDFNRFKAG